MNSLTLRVDGRAADDLRPVRIETNPLAYAEGSALIEVGNTRVLCAATIEERVPPWLRGRGGGWVTAEYAMLPRATQERTQREATRGKLGGRTHEIQRLIGRALRAVTDMKALGERSVLELIGESGGSAQALATQLARAMAMFDDRGFYKRAQIVPANLALAGVASFTDLDRLTIFADNVVPHVLRCEGVLVYDPWLASHIDSGRLLPMGPAEREIRACAVHACELLSARFGVSARVLDNWLWNRGQAPEFKALPRHRCRCVFY